MLLGTFREVRLSADHVKVPDVLRSALELGFVMTRGLDRCVVVFPCKTWEQMLGRIEQGPSYLVHDVRLFQRHFYAGAMVGALDSEGQISLPEDLRSYAELGDEVVLVGLATRLEIWNANRWEEQQAHVMERLDEVSEALSAYDI
jgi:MraZ protein